MSTTKLSWDEYFICILDAVASRASCDRGRSGCVITRDNYVIATGYVGAPSGFPSCDEVGHLILNNHCIRTVHAEQNALSMASKFGISVNGCTLYCTMTPCRVCAMMIIQAGIKRVVCKRHYRITKQEMDTIDMFKEAGIDIHFMIEEVQEYEATSK